MVVAVTLEALVNIACIVRNGASSGVYRAVNYLCCLMALPLMLMIQPAHSASTGLVVSGLGGNAHYQAQFIKHSKTVLQALQSLGTKPGDFVWLDGANTGRDEIINHMALQAQKNTDTFILVLIGHGSADSQGWRFNIAGPDITTEDLVGALAGVQSSQQLVVVAASASGSLLKVLNQPGRILVTATKSAGEINAVRFGQFLAEAMASSIADTDRNEILTIAEAWRFANQKTQDYYEQQKLLASEHARLLGDNSERLPIAKLGALRSAQDNPVVAQLLEQRLILETLFYNLRGRKLSLSKVDYYAELEPLLLSIARLQQKIDAASGWSDSDV